MPDAGTQFTNLLAGKNKAINNFMLGRGQVTESFSTMDPMAEAGFNQNMFDMYGKVRPQLERLEQGSREGENAFDRLDQNQYARDVLSPMERRYRTSSNAIRNDEMLANGKQLHTKSLNSLADQNQEKADLNLNYARETQAKKDRFARMAASEQQQSRMFEDTAGMRGIANATYEMPAPDIAVQRPAQLQDALKMIGYTAQMLLPAGKLGGSDYSKGYSEFVGNQPAGTDGYMSKLKEMYPNAQFEKTGEVSYTDSQDMWTSPSNYTESQEMWSAPSNYTRDAAISGYIGENAAPSLSDVYSSEDGGWW